MGVAERDSPQDYTSKEIKDVLPWFCLYIFCVILDFPF